MNDSNRQDEARPLKPLHDQRLTKDQKCEFQRLTDEIRGDIVEIEARLLRISRNIATVRNQRLYRDKYATFEEYLESEFQKGRQFDYKLCTCYNVLSSLVEQGVANTELPNVQRICLELAKIPEQDRKAIYEMACRQAERQEKPLTAKAITVASEKIRVIDEAE